jgi:putative transposase
VFPGKPRRLSTFDYLGLQRYFLTFCTHRRFRHFERAACVEAVHEQFQRAAADLRFAFLAYCYMPDHVHLLVEGQSDDSDGRRFIGHAKQLSAFRFQAHFGERLWQRYGFERTLRANESPVRVARYVLENPVRAGLVAKVDEYPFLGSDVYTVEQILEAVQMDVGWRGARSG